MLIFYKGYSSELKVCQIYADLWKVMKYILISNVIYIIFLC
jgi:hypothetical protein